MEIFNEKNGQGPVKGKNFKDAFYSKDADEKS
jgi:hypothetical protein